VLPPLRIPQRGYPVDHEEWMNRSSATGSAITFGGTMLTWMLWPA
jgi:hypothetical protein